MPPAEWAIVRICEEFACLPSEAEAELERLPAGMVMDLLQIKAFMHALQTTEQTRDWSTLPKTPMFDLAQDWITERIKARLQGTR